MRRESAWRAGLLVCVATAAGADTPAGVLGAKGPTPATWIGRPAPASSAGMVTRCRALPQHEVTGKDAGSS